MTINTDRVVAVTGGGAGIGAAVVEELGRQGAFVVTMDPMVTLDGSSTADPAPATTASRATPVSVTDGPAVRDLFASLVDEFGRLDAVINVAGISRPTGFARGSAEDWRAVLSVHLDGWRNILNAALPLMTAAGYGRILGVTSGSGWRAADAGAYACAKRAVASLVWELGRAAPPGVVINAMSPIAVTRMVTAALGGGGGGGGPSKATGGLNLGSMPQPEEIGPIGAWLVRDEFDYASGNVFFAGGPEIAVVEPPRLLEVVRTEGAGDLAPVFAAWAKAEAAQASGGGSNPRFPSLFGEVPSSDNGLSPEVAVVSDRREVLGALEAGGFACAQITSADEIGDAEVLVVALAARGDLVDGIFTDAMWARAAAALGRPIRLITVTDATTTDGRARAQASAQLSRAALKATDDRVAAFASSDEGGDASRLVAHLVVHPDAATLSGAELVAGDGFLGLRSHPRPSTSFAIGNGPIPSWLDGTLKEALR